MTRLRSNQWTPAQDADLLRYRKGGLFWREVGVLMRKSGDACKVRFRLITRRAGA